MLVNEANKIVLVISIDLGSTKDDITVRAKDNPEALAKIFCTKHGLDASIQSSITQQIKANLEQQKPQRKPNLAQNSFLKKTQRKPTPQSPLGNRLYQNAFKIQAKKEKLSNQVLDRSCRRHPDLVNRHLWIIVLISLRPQRRGSANR